MMRYCTSFGIILMIAMYSGSGCMGAQGSPRAQVPIKIAKPKPLPPEEERPDPGLEVVEKMLVSEKHMHDIAVYVGGAGGVYVVGKTSGPPVDAWLFVREGKDWSPVRMLRPLPDRLAFSGFVDEKGQFFICFTRRKGIRAITIEFYPVSPRLWDTSLPEPKPSFEFRMSRVEWVRRFPGLSRRLLLVGTYDEVNLLRGPCLTRLQRIRTAVVKDGVRQKSHRVTPHGPFHLLGYNTGAMEPPPIGLFRDGTAFMALHKGYIRTWAPPPEERLYLAYFDGEHWHGCDAVYLPDMGKGSLYKRSMYPYQVVPHGTKVLVFFDTVPETAVIEFDPRIIKGITKASKPLVLTPTEIGGPRTRITKALADKDGNISVLMSSEGESSLIRRIEGRWSRPLKITEDWAYMTIDAAGNHHIVSDETEGLYYYLLAPKQSTVAPESL